MKIIGYKTSVRSHSSPPPTPAWPYRSNSHNKTPLYLINGALNVLDRGRRFSSPSHNSRGCSSRWPQPCWTTTFFISSSAVSNPFALLCFCNNIMKILQLTTSVHPHKEDTLQVAITLIEPFLFFLILFVPTWWRIIDKAVAAKTEATSTRTKSFWHRFKNILVQMGRQHAVVHVLGL